MRKVTRVTRQVQVWAGGVGDLGYHMVRYLKYRPPVRAGRTAAGSEELIRARADGRGWRVVALEIMPRHVHLLVKVIVVTQTDPAPLSATGRSVGVEVGAARFLTTSDGQIIANPKFAAAAAALITDLQRRIERAQRGSGSRQRLRRALAKEWRKVRNRRRDFHHQTARALVNSCGVIALEKLHTAGMTRRARPRPDAENPGGFLPNGAAAKAGLNRSILGAGWAQFASILTAKAESAGRSVLSVNPARTSIDCRRCGRECARPQQDIVICPEHGRMDADLNGACNIATRAGLGSGQAPAA